MLCDPLVLDLDGDGVELTALGSSATMFDLDNDGVAERTGWVGPHDGMLVHDANRNGMVDGVAELFGSANVDGYDELKTIDANNDGRIDASDPAFADLLVWRDLNADGVSSADEMLTLAQAGISRLDLAFTQSNSDAAGNVVARAGSYVRTDGTTRAMASVQFATDETGLRPGIPDGAALGNLPILPNLPASAGIPDLRTAMFFDPTLKAMVEDLVLGAHDFETFADFSAGGFIDVLYRWTGVDTSIPASVAEPHYFQVIEALTGMSLDVLSDGQRARLDDFWPDFVKQVGTQFLFQAAQNPALQPFLNLSEALAALDPGSLTFNDDVVGLVEMAIANSATIAPAYDYLELFTGLTLDPLTGGLKGDFDAFVAAVLEGQPSFLTSSLGAVSGNGGGGTGSMTMDGGGGGHGNATRHPWTAWYEDQGSLLFSVANTMGIASDYVLNVTGWHWLSGEATRHQGTEGNDTIDLTVTYYGRVITEVTANGGRVSSIVQVPTRDQLIFGHEGNDELRANDGVDRLVGGPGDDLLDGGWDSDMYVYASGDGLDRIIDQNGVADTIYFSTELNSDDLRVGRITGTNDLLIHFGNAAEGIVLTNQWGWSSAAVEQFHFVGEDGLNAGDIASRYLATLATTGADVITGSWADERISSLAGDDTLFGAGGDDALDGGAGNDILNGDDGHDNVIGAAGNDRLFGGSGDDTLTGGTGDDRLEGGSGNDTYVYNRGDG